MRVNTKISSVAWDVVDRFIRDWQDRPYFWDREIDIQVTLAARLAEAYALLGNSTVCGYYPGAPAGYEKLQEYSRVACEPPLRLHATGLSRVKCLPDIVVWKDIPDPATPPHAYKWPIHWLCEIKYSKSRTAWDEDKLQKLLDIRAADEACVLHFQRRPVARKESITWTRTQKVYVCKVRLPIRTS